MESIYNANNSYLLKSFIVCDQRRLSSNRSTRISSFVCTGTDTDLSKETLRSHSIWAYTSMYVHSEPEQKQWKTSTYTISKKYTLQLPRCFLVLIVFFWLVGWSPANLSFGLIERSRHSHTLLRLSGCQNQTCWYWSIATLKPKRTADITVMVIQMFIDVHNQV